MIDNIETKREQLYKQGDIIRIVGYGHLIYDYTNAKTTGIRVSDLRPELVGKYARVNYSYEDRFGIREDNIGNNEYDVTMINDDGADGNN